MNRMLATIRSAADAAPADRDRYLDFLRAASILVVVVGHWLVAAIWLQDGTLRVSSALVESPAARALTWVVQVMPIFFLVGGVVGARSWRSARGARSAWASWMRGRAARLLRPSAVLLWSWVVIAAVAGVAGVELALLKTASQAALVPLWFLAVYLGVVALTPILDAGVRRFGVATPVALTALAGVVDAAHLAGMPLIGWTNFIVVWSACYALGIAWGDGRLNRIPGWALFAAGLASLVALVTWAGYPVSMVGVDGAARSNNSPPSLALVVLGWMQTGAVMAAARSARTWLTRARVWRGVVAVNFAVMTVYLWHLTLMVAVVGALLLLDVGLSTQPLTAAWWATRPVWVSGLAVLLLPIVALLAPVELSTPRPLAVSSRGGTAIVALATVAAMGGIATLVTHGAADVLRTLAVAIIIHVAAVALGAFHSPLAGSRRTSAGRGAGRDPATSGVAR